MSILLRQASVFPPFMFIAHDPQIPDKQQLLTFILSQSERQSYILSIIFFFFFIIPLLRFNQQTWYWPSLQERRKVRVESISFFILIRASRTIGPQLYGEKEKHKQKISKRTSLMWNTYMKDALLFGVHRHVYRRKLSIYPNWLVNRRRRRTGDSPGCQNNLC